jgi:hypothetical protein
MSKLDRADLHEEVEVFLQGSKASLRGGSVHPSDSDGGPSREGDDEDRPLVFLFRHRQGTALATASSSLR